MKYPIYFLRMKSNNYQVSDETLYTYECKNETELKEFFNRVSFEKSTTYSRQMRGLKKAQVLRANYSQSNAYYSDAAHFIKSNSL